MGEGSRGTGRRSVSPESARGLKRSPTLRDCLCALSMPHPTERVRHTWPCTYVSSEDARRGGQTEQLYSCGSGVSLGGMHVTSRNTPVLRRNEHQHLAVVEHRFEVWCHCYSSHDQVTDDFDAFRSSLDTWNRLHRTLSPCQASLQSPIDGLPVFGV